MRRNSFALGGPSSTLGDATRPEKSSRTCALDALSTALLQQQCDESRTPLGWHPHVRLLADVIGRREDEDPGRVVVAFNDQVALDAKDVARVLEACAEKLEADR